VLYGFWYANLGAFNGDALCDLAAQFLALAEKQGRPCRSWSGIAVGSSSLHTGDFVDNRAHFEQALSLYDPDKHRSLATWHGQDIRVLTLSFRSITLWIYPEAALTDVDQAVRHAREIDHAPSLIYALAATSVPQLLAGNYASVNAQTDEAVAIAQEKSEVFWKAWGRILQGCVLDLTCNASEAVHQVTSGIAAYQSTGATVWLRQALSYLAKAYAHDVLAEHVLELLRVTPVLWIAVLQPEDRCSRFWRHVFDVGCINGFRAAGRHEDLDGLIVIAVGMVVERTLCASSSPPSSEKGTYPRGCRGVGVPCALDGRIGRSFPRCLAART
jgi:hypothetical protein